MTDLETARAVTAFLSRPCPTCGHSLTLGNPDNTHSYWLYPDYPHFRVECSGKKEKDARQPVDDSEASGQEGHHRRT